MSAVLQAIDSLDEDEFFATVRLADARRQDAHWQRTFRGEPYFRRGLDYEDYAPAYCVGYTGHAQYGGSFEDAERSLWANWERIKGDSRLAFDDAMTAVRAAWDRMDRGERAAAGMAGAGALRRGAMASSFEPVFAGSLG